MLLTYLVLVYIHAYMCLSPPLPLPVIITPAQPNVLV